MDQSEWVVDGHNNSFSCSYDAKKNLKIKKIGSFQLIKLFVRKLFFFIMWCGCYVVMEIDELMSVMKSLKCD
jgi:hypothetical protein